MTTLRHPDRRLIPGMFGAPPAQRQIEARAGPGVSRGAGVGWKAGFRPTEKL
jgi:hypothetical protein